MAQIPMNLLEKTGVAEYNQQHAKRSITFAPFVLEQATKSRDLRNPTDKQAAFDEILPFLRVTRNSIERREFFDAAINRLNIDEAHRSELLKTLQLNANANQAKPNFNELKQQINAAVKIKPTIAEQELLELLLHDAELREAILPTLEPSDYEHLASAQIFRALIELHENDAELTFENLQKIVGESDFLGVLFLSEPARAEDEALDDYLSRAENCVISLRQMAIERRLREIKDELVRAEQNRENDRFNTLLVEQMELSRLRNDLGRLV
jgi:DNA primase